MSKMIAIKLDNIDEALEYLLPKSGIIVIGKIQYEISELVEEQYNKLSDLIVGAFETLYKSEEKIPDETMYYAKLLQVVIQNINPILVVITGLKKEEIASNLTAQQAAYAAGVICKVNFDNFFTQLIELRKTLAESYEIFNKEEAVANA
jgi:hypothetical protein